MDPITHWNDIDFDQAYAALANRIRDGAVYFALLELAVEAQASKV